MWYIKQDLSVVVVNLKHLTLDFHLSMTAMKAKAIIPALCLDPSLIKATHNDYMYFSISHFTNSFASLSKEKDYRATCASPLPLVTMLSYTFNAI